MKTIELNNEIIKLAIDIKNNMQNVGWEEMNHFLLSQLDKQYNIEKQKQSDLDWSEIDTIVRDKFSITEPIFCEAEYNIGDADVENLAREAAEFFYKFGLESLSKVGSMNDDILSYASLFLPNGQIMQEEIIYRGYPIVTTEVFDIIYKNEIIKMIVTSSSVNNDNNMCNFENKKHNIYLEYSDEDMNFYFHKTK